MKFLSAQVYTDAFLQTGSLSPSDWELRKFAIYLKSTYLEYAKEKEDTTSVQKVCSQLQQYVCSSYNLYNYINQKKTHCLMNQKQ